MLFQIEVIKKKIYMSKFFKKKLVNTYLSMNVVYQIGVNIIGLPLFYTHTVIVNKREFKVR